jgi:serine/threonine protein kinase
MRQPPPEIPGLSFVQRLGSGGFADVHLYRQELPQMLVAVKVLRTASGDLREQLVAEANTMAQLAEHPYIVTILRADVTEDGRPYLVMAYYPRPNLSARARSAPLSVPEVLRTGVQLASAVETAHRAGVLHRDIKPANVLVTSYGTPALADFGVAGRAGLVDHEDEVGVSVAWAPPEVLTGRSNGSVAADVYSLTATLFYLLTGRTPFEQVGSDNSQDALLARTVSQPPPRDRSPGRPGRARAGAAHRHGQGPGAAAAGRDEPGDRAAAGRAVPRAAPHRDRRPRRARGSAHLHRRSHHGAAAARRPHARRRAHPGAGGPAGATAGPPLPVAVARRRGSPPCCSPGA